MRRAGQGNLYLARWLAICSGCRFGLGIWILYFLHYTTYAGIGVAEALMILVALLAEIPTGVLADRLGRKRSLFLAYLGFSIGFLIVSLADSYSFLLLGLLVFVLGRAMHSGTFEAFVFENSQDPFIFESHIVKLHSLRLAAFAGSCALGGFAFNIWPRLPYFLTTLACFVGLVLTLFIQEKPSSLDSEKGQNLLDVTPIQLFLAWRPQTHIAFVILAGGMILVFCDEILDDALAVAFGFSPHHLGLLFAVVHLLSALASQQSGFLKKRIGSVRLMGWILLLCSLSLLLSPVFGLFFGGASVVLRYMCRTVWTNLESIWLNASIQHANRATALSCYAMYKSLPYVLLAFPAGKWMDSSGPFQLGICVGLILLPIGGAFLMGHFQDRCHQKPPSVFQK